MLRLKFLAGMIILAALSTWAHGEDTPGPHAGHIQMPANFHTEVVPNKDGSFKVYLIDLEFKNPVTENSQVLAHILFKKKKTQIKCAAKLDYFDCTGSQNLRKGVLVLTAIRSGTKASMDAQYDLPFKAFKTKEASPDHSMHH